jgi:hypothetical protein
LEAGDNRGANLNLVVVRTDSSVGGTSGLSAIVIETRHRGSQLQVDQHTRPPNREITFDNARVPAANMIEGAKGNGDPDQSELRLVRPGLLDELVLHVVPVVLGAGERLLDGLDGLALEPVEVIASPVVTHLRYRVPPPLDLGLLGVPLTT